MNLMEYVTNPTGKGSSFMSAGNIRNDLNNQYELLKSRIKAAWFIKDDHILIYNIGIPSRTAKDVFYNVVFELDLNKVPDNETTINKIDFKCFSNCPSFTFTYAYIFNKKNMLCKWLTGKYTREILHKSPDIRNEYNIIGYERSLYIAARYILSNGRNRVNYIRTLAMKAYSYNDVARYISSQEEIKVKYEKGVAKPPKKEEPTKTERTPRRLFRKVSDKYTKTTGFIKNTIHTQKTKKTKKF